MIRTRGAPRVFFFFQRAFVKEKVNLVKRNPFFVEKQVRWPVKILNSKKIYHL